MALAYTIEAFTNDDVLPGEAEDMFKDELADSRRDRPGIEKWRFLTICALSHDGRVLGGAHLDVGPMEFGPLGDEKLAYLEQLLVLPEHRRQGLGAALLLRSAEEAGRHGCNHIRFNVSWQNPAAIAVCQKAGFALTCLEDGGYFVMQPTGGVPSYA